MNRLFAGTLAACLATGSAALDAAPKLDPRFPAAVEFIHDGERFALDATGSSVRRQMIFKVYTVSHYLEEAPGRSIQAAARRSASELLDDVMSDGVAKQLIIEAEREIPHQALGDSLRKCFWRGAAGDVSQELSPLLERYLGEIRRDVVKGDRLVVRWLPGGRMVSLIGGEVVSSIENEAFVRRFWAIWFGADSNFDKAALLQRLAGGADSGDSDPASRDYLNASTFKAAAQPAFFN